MIIEDLTPAQRIIIRKICILQLDSLRRLLYDQSEMDFDVVSYLKENEVTREEYEFQLIKNIKKFTILSENPDDLRVLDEYDQSKFRHILSVIEIKYIKEYPKAISNLWQRIFLIEQLGVNQKAELLN